MFKKIGFAIVALQIGIFATATGLDVITDGRVGVTSALAQWPSQTESSDSANVASVPDATPPDVSGDWNGTLTDTNKGTGAFSMTITQTGGKLSGMWTAFFAGGSSPLKGKVNGKGIVHITLVGEGKCHIVAIANLPSANEMVASYKYKGCNKELKQDFGAFDVTR